jgi:chemosensory pili system protein ChpA (sensor histidine kinase/response regulator)
MADAAGLVDEIVAGNDVTEEAVTALRARIDALPPIEVEAREEATVVLDRAPSRSATPAPTEAEAPADAEAEALETDDAFEASIVEALGATDEPADAEVEMPADEAALTSEFEAQVEEALAGGSVAAEWFEESAEAEAAADSEVPEWFAAEGVAAAPEWFDQPDGEGPALEPAPEEPEEAPATEAEVESFATAAPKESAPAVASADAVAAAAEPAEEYDPDIALIFAEEAAELLEQAEGALAAWRAQPAQREPLHSLQRVLHTLKGGARMAGLMRTGTVSHDLETLLTNIAGGRMDASDDVFELVQHSFDRLHNVRERLSAGQPPGPLSDLIERIRSLSLPQEAEPVAEVGTPVETPHAVSTVERPPSAEPVEASAAPPMEDVEEVDQAPPEPVDFEVAAESETPAVSAELAGIAPEEEIAAETEEVAPAAEVTTPDDVAQPDEVAAAADDVSTVEEEAPAVEEHAAAAAPPVIAPDVMPPAPVAPMVWSAQAEPARPAVPTQRQRREFARVDAGLLESLLNNAGEISIFRARLEQELSSIDFNLGELSQTVTRLREQLRKLELETEAQIRFRHQDEDPRHRDFDPLELDRYSSLQQLSRALAESLSDLTSIQELMADTAQDSQGLLVQQSRVTTELQDGLMRTRMIPFSQHAQRLGRIVRQTALEVGKLAELRIDGGSGELDRQVLERMLPPFEHMLRNAVVHGVESLEIRRAAGKPDVATIGIRLRREGSQVVIDVTDDGRGLPVAMIREKAQALGMLDPTATLTDSDALQLILQPGFSTATTLTQAAGRGVGMDVVANEVRQLGGSLDVLSESGVGTRFTIRLPFTLAITQALLVRAAEELYAIPLPTVEGIVRVPSRELRAYLEPDSAPFVYGGQAYQFKHLGVLLGTAPAHIADGGAPVPVILVRAGEHSSALVADEMLGSREVVVKSVGPQIAAVRGVSGATILGDGSIAVILDISALVRTAPARPVEAPPARAHGDERPLALVVDDSITVRRVTQRLLERHGVRVVTAKDGVDAIAAMQEQVPDVLVLDIEMPRMDGYEVVAYVRNDDRLAHIPIVMVTSRVGQKHRAHGLALGVNEYLGKPYQEKELLGAIERFLAAKERGARRG